MADYVLYRGEDKLIEVTIKDSAGSAVDLDTLDGIQAYIVDSRKSVLVKFSLNGESGFETLTKSDAANGKYQIRLQSDRTGNARLETYSIETKIQRTDAAYDNSSKMDVAVVDDFIEIKDASSKGDNDLTA